MSRAGRYHRPCNTISGIPCARNRPKTHEAFCPAHVAEGRPPAEIYNYAHKEGLFKTLPHVGIYWRRLSSIQDVIFRVPNQDGDK